MARGETGYGFLQVITGLVVQWQGRYDSAGRWYPEKARNT